MLSGRYVTLPYDFTCLASRIEGSDNGAPDATATASSWGDVCVSVLLAGGEDGPSMVIGFVDRRRLGFSWTDDVIPIVGSLKQYNLGSNMNGRGTDYLWSRGSLSRGQLRIIVDEYIECRECRCMIRYDFFRTTSRHFSSSTSPSTTRDLRT